MAKTRPSRLEYSDIPDLILSQIRARAMAMPEAAEVQAWNGRRWVIRRRNFAHVATLGNEEGDATYLTFRSSGDELTVLWSTGHPFFRPGWGTNVVGMILSQDTDWEEVGELLYDSYCIQAPKKLVALAVGSAPPVDFRHGRAVKAHRSHPRPPS